MELLTNWTKFIQQKKQEKCVADPDVVGLYIQEHCSDLELYLNIQSSAESMFSDALEIEESYVFNTVVKELVKYFSSDVVDGVLFELINTPRKIDQVKHLIKTIPLHSIKSKEKMALRACIYLGYNDLLGDVNALYADSNISFEVFKILIVSEDKAAEKWFFNEFPMFLSQRETGFFLKLFQFVLFNPTKNGINYLRMFQNNVDEELKCYCKGEKPLVFAFAHRCYSIHKEASNNDLALLLSIISDSECQNIAIDFLRKAINVTSHFKQMIFNGSFNEAQMCSNYIENGVIDDLLQVLPAETVDKMKYTDTLYPRFLNRVLYKAIEPIIETTTTKSVRRL